MRREPDVTAPPIVQALDTAFRYLRWLALLLAVLYLGSGVTTVRPDQEAIILRLGKYARVVPSGFLFAWPYPIDEVVTVSTRKAKRLEMKDEFWKPLPGIVQGGEGKNPLAPDTVFAEEYVPDKIDPTREGYCITGDKEILQVYLAVKYRTVDSVDFALRQANPEELLRDAVMSAVTHTIGETRTDDALRMREVLAGRIRSRAQARLDAVNCGIKIQAVELVYFHPPRHVIRQFQEVTRAEIEKARLKQEALRDQVMRESHAPQQATQIVTRAENEARTLREKAVGRAQAFRELLTEYLKNPLVVAARLYRETMEEIIAKAQVRAVTVTKDGKTTLVTDFVKAPPKRQAREQQQTRKGQGQEGRSQ